MAMFRNSTVSLTPTTAPTGLLKPKPLKPPPAISSTRLLLQITRLRKATSRLTGESWNFDTETTVSATDEIISAIVAEYYTPDADETQDYEGVTYTFDGENWNYDTTTTETAATEIAAAIVEAYYLPSEGDTADIDEITYTFDGENWNYDTETTETAATEIAAAIVEAYYLPSDGDSQELDGVTSAKAGISTLKQL